MASTKASERQPAHLGEVVIEFRALEPAVMRGTPTRFGGPRRVLLWSAVAVAALCALGATVVVVPSAFGEQPVTVESAAGELYIPQKHVALIVTVSPAQMLR